MISIGIEYVLSGHTEIKITCNRPDWNSSPFDNWNFAQNIRIRAYVRISVGLYDAF